MNIRIGTRNSPLAGQQVREILPILNGFSYEITVFKTRGDTDKNTPIDQIEGTDFFTDTIQKALLEGIIDLAVHSAKDLPDLPVNGIETYICKRSIDPDDVLVSKNNVLFNDLPYGAKIGTSSRRRKEQLLKARRDLCLRDIRGNIIERLEVVDQGIVDGIVIAAAGLIRLGYSYRITERLHFMEPHPLQGALSLEIRNDNEALKKIIAGIEGWEKRGIGL